MELRSKKKAKDPKSPKKMKAANKSRARIKIWIKKMDRVVEKRLTSRCRRSSLRKRIKVKKKKT